MKRTLATVGVAALIVALYLYSQSGSDSPEAVQALTPLSTSDDTPTPDIVDADTSLAAQVSEADAAVECDLEQLEKLQQFNRTNMRRLENSRLEPEAIAAYRELELSELKAMFEQGDTLAMIVYGMHFLFASMGRNPELAVDYLYYQMPIKEITPNPKGVPENAARYASEARRAFTEAAMRGRHAAFTFIGLTYVAEGKNAVDLFWLTQDAYDSLTDKQKFSVEPRIVYSQLAYRMDPNLLPVGSPNRKMFDENFAALGEHGRFFEWVELAFRQRMRAKGLSFPALPEVNYPDVDSAVIEACEEQGFSRWD